MHPGQTPSMVLRKTGAFHESSPDVPAKCGPRTLEKLNLRQRCAGLDIPPTDESPRIGRARGFHVAQVPSESAGGPKPFRAGTASDSVCGGAIFQRRGGPFLCGAGKSGFTGAVFRQTGH